MRVLNFPSAYQAGERPYDIFKNRMTAITSIVGGIKDMIANKYTNKQMAMIAENIQSEIDKQKAIDLTHLISDSPPNEIYPSNLENTIGQFIDKFTMGPMMRKETMTGGLPFVGGATPTPTTMPTTEAMIPKTDLYQLYNVIKDLPSGQVSWDNIYKKMTEKKPWFMGTTGPEQYVVDQMMGQSGDPKAKMVSDINLAKLYQETFHPEKVVEPPTEWDKRLDLFMQTDPSVEEVKKFVGGYVTPERLSDFDKRFNLLMQANPSDDEVKKFVGGYIAPESNKITSEIDFFRKDPQGYAEMMKLKQSIIGEKKSAWETEVEHLLKFREEGLINDDELKKGMGVYVTPEKMSEFDKKFALAQKLNLTDNEWKKFFGVYITDDVIIETKFYKTPDEVIASEPKIPGMMIDPTLDKTRGWYANYVKETKEDPNNYLFGKKDVYGNISRMGIIPYDAQTAISYGQPLTDIQKTQIRNNHNLQKSLLDEGMLVKVEAILKQIDVPLEVEVVLPTGPQSLPGEAPISGEIPPMEVPTEEKEALIPIMSDKELYDALYGLDQVDPMYKLLYNEAVKRGLIAK